MAMNKREQAHFYDLQAKLLVAYALHWTSEVKPDVPPPIGPALTTGWLFNSYSKTVTPACSSSSGHGTGQDTRPTTKGARSLYSTKERALRALRHAMEQQYAEALAIVDAQIKTYSEDL